MEIKGLSSLTLTKFPLQMEGVGGGATRRVTNKAIG